MIDWNKPYGKICGELDEYPNARYVQDGKYYRVNGEEAECVNAVGDSNHSDIYKPADDESADAEVAVGDSNHSDEYERVPGNSVLEDKSDFESMHWKTLKGLVEDKGGEWTNKKDAIEYLSNGNLS